MYNESLLKGLPSRSPFDLIIIDGPMYKVNKYLKQQLSENGGRLIYIKKIYDNLGKAYKITRNEDLYSSIYLFDVMSTYQIQSKEKDFNF